MSKRPALYEILYEDAASKALDALPRKARDNLEAKIDALALDPRPEDATKMEGVEAWRIRWGDYRALYQIDDLIVRVLVIRVGQRKDIYRHL